MTVRLKTEGQSRACYLTYGDCNFDELELTPDGKVKIPFSFDLFLIPDYDDDDLKFGDRIVKAECSDTDGPELYIPEDSELGRELVARGLVDDHNKK